MRIFLSALENNSEPVLRKVEKDNIRIHDGLMSYYYLQKAKPYMFDLVSSLSDHILIDSGAHSFQKGANVPWEEYTHQYADWIQKHDSDQILGYFEMDVDKRLGYPRVLGMRKILENVTDKIIPVWHKGRGIDEFKKMCHETRGDIVAVTGFRNEDIMDNQYPAFLKYAWKCGKKLHCLGMTRTKVLKKIPFDFVDSSSWKQAAVYGSVAYFKNNRVAVKQVKGRYTTTELQFYSLKAYMQLAEYYNAKWSKINHDLYIARRFVISRLIKLRRFWHENYYHFKGRVGISIVRGCDNHFSSIELWSRSASRVRTV